MDLSRPRRSLLAVARTLAVALLFLLTLAARTAAADTLVIKRPGAHPNYDFEAEPHALLGFIDPPGPGHGNGFGFGFRGTFELVDNGFVETINNTIGIGFGADYVHYSLGRSRCVEALPGQPCVREGDEYAVENLWFPIVMQWNFFLSRNWSVFGEPGGAIRYESSEGDDSELKIEPLQMYVGGRYHFAEAMTLTMRLGYPTFSVGLSFLL